MKSTNNEITNIKFFFDTQIYDIIYEQNIEIKKISQQGKFFICSVQLDEIDAIPIIKDKKKQGIKKIIKSLNCIQIPLNSGDKWPPGNKNESIMRLHDEDIRCETESQCMKDFLENVQEKSHYRDALISDTAHQNNLILIVADKGHHQRAIKSGVEAILRNDRIKIIT